MSLQATVSCMDVPVCPPQAGGWECLVYKGVNLSWKICARRGSRAEHNLQIAIFERLSQDDVRNFDITKRR